MNSKITDYSAYFEEKLYSYFDGAFPEYKVLFDSMEYSVKNGGKRVRPILTMLFCDACGGDFKASVPMAQAVEFIHTYSLIHDDLPCMDNDDFRRGKPSNHKVYGEAFALLAGDGLLTAAFERISSFSPMFYSAQTAIKAVQTLSALAGARGMIGGQVIDLSNENNPEADLNTLRLMDNLKTGALISAACALGVIAANGTDEQIENAKKFGNTLGLAFQIKDDILDVTSTLEKLGKNIGSDAQNNKTTYVKLLGLEKCQELVKVLTDEALGILDLFPENEALKDYALYLADREF